MITFLNGAIVEKQPTRLVIDVGGVGYEALIPLSSYDRLPAKNETCKILIYDHIREDAHTLFGFMSKAERALFALLLGISGIGPKLALSALSSLSVREIKIAIIEGDAKRLSSVSGVGKKTAERIVIDLRDRISEGEALEAIAGVDEASEQSGIPGDAVMALVALGYKQHDAQKMVAQALRKSDPDTTVETIIKHALSK